MGNECTAWVMHCLGVLRCVVMYVLCLLSQLHTVRQVRVHNWAYRMRSIRHISH